MTGENDEGQSRKHEKSLPAASSNDAPSLERGADEEDVAEFLEQIEDIINKNQPSLWKPENFKESKKALMSYLHGTMKKQFWSGFKKVRDYNGLKKAIYNVYLNAEKVGNGSLRTLMKLLDDNQNLSRKKLKFALEFVREFKVEAEALMDDESQKAKISDFQIFKWVKGAFEMSTRDQIRMRMMLNGKPKEVEVNTPSRASGSNDTAAATPARRYRTVRRPQVIDWNEFDDWKWYIEKLIAYC
jgi:hypothetical protein